MILQDTQFNLQTREIDETEAWQILDWLLACFERHGVEEVILILGLGWEVGDKSWADQLVKVADIRKIISEAEAAELGCLVYDDVYIKLDEETQIHFCHHEDLHLNYNVEQLPIVEELRDYFINSIGLLK